jgi:cytochrome c2
MSDVVMSGRRLAAALAVVVPLALAAGAARADGDAAKGEKKFEECASCHSTADGQNGVGPSLHGVIGRKAGNLVDYRYSAPMKRSGITWTAKSIDEFIADPQKLIPGNRMPFSGLPGAGDRADLIAYLEKTTK